MKVLLLVVECIEELFLLGLNVDDLVEEVVLDALYVGFEIVELVNDV